MEGEVAHLTGQGDGFKGAEAEQAERALIVFSKHISNRGPNEFTMISIAEPNLLTRDFGGRSSLRAGYYWLLPDRFLRQSGRMSRQANSAAAHPDRGNQTQHRCRLRERNSTDSEK